MHYRTFLIKQGFEAFLSIPPHSVRHGLTEALVQQFHEEIGAFHLSCEEYAMLPLDWTVILGLRFRGEPVSIEFVSVSKVCELLGIEYPLTVESSRFFGPIEEPQIYLAQLETIISWEGQLNNVARYAWRSWK